MITEDSLSDKEPLQENEKSLSPENTTLPHQADVDTEISVKIPEEKVLSEIDEHKEEMLQDEIIDESSETALPSEITENKPANQADTDTQKPHPIPEEKVLSEIDREKAEAHEIAVAHLTLGQTLIEMEKIVNQQDAGYFHKKFSLLKDHANHLIHEETAHSHQEAEGNTIEENLKTVHPDSRKITELNSIFREKQDEFHKKQNAEQHLNLENRQKIIDRLKNLYTNAEPGVNLFQEIRSIKDDWQNAGQVAKSEFKLLNNNYFHHLNQFYDMLEMNKEYREQEFAHNLEKRLHIIERAKQLENEPMIQKALNELQYLHKLWKEEAEPVAEEFREKTWENFKEISDRIHDRKTELSSQIEADQTANLEKKNLIIEEIRKIAAEDKNSGHGFWQNAIKKVEELRNDFLKTGNVPRKVSNQNWDEFKSSLRDFNVKKNEFYKNLKGTQHTNFEEKTKLIQTAKENMHSEDWETVVPLFKKLQDDWKKIGHVPKSQANKMWEEFREACNVFFQNFREKNVSHNDNWKENFAHKKALLEELKLISDEEGSVEKIEHIKTSWNAIGKVPKEKLGINTEFNKTLREKLKLNKLNEFDLKEEGLSESQITDKARKIKNQITDLEAEIAKLENNLAFFSNSSRENPLLKDAYQNIDGKKTLLENLKQNLHHIISGE